MRPVLALAALLLVTLVGCAPCQDYCEEQCACDDDEASTCVESCMETLELYSADVREDECTTRLEELQETCR